MLAAGAKLWKLVPSQDRAARVARYLHSMCILKAFSDDEDGNLSGGIGQLETRPVLRLLDPIKGTRRPTPR